MPVLNFVQKPEPGPRHTYRVLRRGMTPGRRPYLVIQTPTYRATVVFTGNCRRYRKLRFTGTPESFKEYRFPGQYGNSQLETRPAAKGPTQPARISSTGHIWRRRHATKRRAM